jgi:hypothetical protein
VQPANGGTAEPAQPSAAAAPDAWAPPVANGHAPAAADLDSMHSRQPAAAAAPLFPLHDAAAAGAPAVDGLVADRQQALLFPSFEDAGSAVAAAGPAAAGLQGLLRGPAAALRRCRQLPASDRRRAACLMRASTAPLRECRRLQALPQYQQQNQTCSVATAQQMACQQQQRQRRVA